MRVLVLLLIGACGAGFGELTAESAVADFYTAYRAAAVSGLPTAAQMNKLQPFLSLELRAALARAGKEQARCRKAYSDEKPPWIEGDLFTSNFEGFTKFQVRREGAAVAVHFTYVENGFTVKWTDRVTVTQASGRWVLDDIRFKDGKSTLRAGLAGKGC